MRDHIVRTLKRICSISLLVTACAIGAMAQSAPSPPTASAGGLQTLMGTIRWKKTMGVPVSPESNKIPIDAPCSIFWVAAYDTEFPHKLVWFDNALKPGRAKPEYYACSYRIILPAGRRLLMQAGMGPKNLFKYGFRRLTAGYYNEFWIGDSDRDRFAGPGFKAPNVDRTFKPFEMGVTLSSTQPTLLNFEMIWGVRTDGGFQ